MSKDTMDRRDAEIAAVVRAMHAEPSSHPESHPATDDLLAYHEGTLSEVAAESIRDHVARCPECARRSLDAAAFCQPDVTDDEDGPVGRGETGWRALRSRLGEGDRLQPQKKKPGIGKHRSAEESPSATMKSTVPRFDWGAWSSRLFGSLRFAYALASLFFVATLSTSMILVQRSRMVVELSQPVPIQLVGLHPAAEDLRRSSTSPAGAQIPRTQEELAFSLSFSIDRPLTGSFRAMVFDRNHPDIRWKIEPLPRDPAGFFSLRIPGRLLPLGKYRIDIHELESTVLASYFFEIIEPVNSRRSSPGKAS